MDGSYNVFFHVLDAQGELQGQGDRAPVNGDYPTSMWQPGETIVDAHRVPLRADALLESLEIAVGMYDIVTHERLPAVDGSGQKAPDGRIMLDLAVEGGG